MFIWNCREIFNVTYTVHWFRSWLSPCIMCIMTQRWNFDNDHNNWKLKISCKTEMYSSGPKSTSVCVRTMAGMELWKDFKLHVSLFAILLCLGGPTTSRIGEHYNRHYHFHIISFTFLLDMGSILPKKECELIEIVLQGHFCYLL